MGEVIPYKVGEYTIWIEASEVEASEVEASEDKRLMSILTASKKGLGEDFQKVLKERVQPFCNALLDTLTNIQPKPTSIRAEFGLAFNGGMNIIIVKLGGDVTIKVTLEWQNKISG